MFVDTNVLIYFNRPNMPQHMLAQSALARLQAEESPLWISPQILREYLAAATRLQASGATLSMADAIVDVQDFRLAFNVTDDSPDTFDCLLSLLAVHPGAGKQVHDANLVASMLNHGINHLLTFNVADFRRFDKIIDLVNV